MSSINLKHALAVALVFGAFVASADAQPRRDDHHDRGRWVQGPTVYVAPPVVYAQPYVYYGPPPVVYGPAVGLYVPGVSVTVQ